MTQRLLAQELATLGLDLADTLREDPRFLTDGAFLGALHLELRQRLGEGDARAALLQLGFLHGLRDSLELITRTLHPGLSAPTTTPRAPRVALALDSPRIGADGALRGRFRDGIEARAVKGSLGECSAPACALTSGYASGWLSGLFESDLLALEQCCAATGAPRCEFLAHTPAGWSANGDARAQADLAQLPFSPLRELVARRLAELATSSEGERDSFERGAPVIHVWGPVMVIPFAGADETLSGLELIRRDAGARDVCVVVLDLAGAIIDESFGALELERVIEATQQLGAEPILTGISPLSERAVAGLELAHLIVRKDLPDAIATAFQIADASARLRRRGYVGPARVPEPRFKSAAQPDERRGVGNLAETPLPGLLLSLARDGFEGWLDARAGRRAAALPLAQRAADRARLLARGGQPAGRAHGARGPHPRGRRGCGRSACARRARARSRRWPARASRPRTSCWRWPPRSSAPSSSASAGRRAASSWSSRRRRATRRRSPSRSPPWSTGRSPRAGAPTRCWSPSVRARRASPTLPPEALPRLDGRLAKQPAFQALLPLLDGTRTPFEALREARHPEAHAALWLLDAQGLLVTTDQRPSAGAARPARSGPQIEIVVAGAAAAAGAERSASAAGAKRDPAREAAAKELAREVASLHAQLAELDHWQILGVGRSTSPGDVKRAYLKLAKRLHPDHLVRLGLAEWKEKANEVFAQVSRAHEVLSDPDERARYEESLSGVSETEALLAAQAEQYFQRGEMLIRAGNFRGALQLLERAVQTYERRGGLSRALRLGPAPHDAAGQRPRAPALRARPRAGRRAPPAPVAHEPGAARARRRGARRSARPARALARRRRQGVTGCASRLRGSARRARTSGAIAILCGIAQHARQVEHRKAVLAGVVRVAPEDARRHVAGPQVGALELVGRGDAREAVHELGLLGGHGDVGQGGARRDGVEGAQPRRIERLAGEHPLAGVPRRLGRRIEREVAAPGVPGPAQRVAELVHECADQLGARGRARSARRLPGARDLDARARELGALSHAAVRHRPTRGRAPVGARQRLVAERHLDLRMLGGGVDEVHAQSGTLPGAQRSVGGRALLGRRGRIERDSDRERRIEAAGEQRDAAGAREDVRMQPGQPARGGRPGRRRAGERDERRGRAAPHARLGATRASQRTNSASAAASRTAAKP